MLAVRLLAYWRPRVLMPANCVCSEEATPKYDRTSSRRHVMIANLKHGSFNAIVFVPWLHLQGCE